MTWLCRKAHVFISIHLINCKQPEHEKGALVMQQNSLVAVQSVHRLPLLPFQEWLIILDIYCFSAWVATA
jgi:hypothetical protein